MKLLRVLVLLSTVLTAGAVFSRLLIAQQPIAPVYNVAAGAKGKVDAITVHGKALEGNLEGDSPDRAVFVYLPPSYLASQTRRYPVV